MNNLSLREELKEYFKENGEEMWDYEYHINEVMKIFEKQIDELDEEYKLKVQDAKYRIGYYNALLDVRDLLK